MVELEKKLSEHTQRLINLEEDVKDHKKELKLITKVMMDIHDLVSTIKSLQEEQRAQRKALERLNDKLSCIELEPAVQWKKTIQAIKIAIISTMAGALGMGLIWLMSKGMRL